MNRRDFIKIASLGSVGFFMNSNLCSGQETDNFNVYDLVTKLRFRKDVQDIYLDDVGKCIVSNGYVFANPDSVYRRTIINLEGNPISTLDGEMEIKERKIRNGDFEQTLGIVDVDFKTETAFTSASGLNREYFKDFNFPIYTGDLTEKAFLIPDENSFFNGEILYEDDSSFLVEFPYLSQSEFDNSRECNVFFGPNKLAGAPIINQKGKLVGICSGFYVEGRILVGTMIKIENYFKNLA